MILEEGNKAPEFTLPDGEGKEVALKDYLGKKVILYFYPKDMTKGCTQEACDFRDNLPEFERLGVDVLGISKDPVASHKRFADKHDLNFILLSDEEVKVSESYGVWKEKSMYGRKYMGIERSTFVIDEQGMVQKSYRKVKVTGHVDTLLAELNNGIQ